MNLGPGGVEANDDSYGPIRLSADDRLVAFASWGTNLVDGAQMDIFVRDRAAATTTLASVTPTGAAFRIAYLGGLSADGRVVAFHSPPRSSLATPTA